jgi:hypothetical protein
VRPGKDIEDQFANAVKLALETRAPIEPPPVVLAEPPQFGRRRRFDQWHITLLYVALTATVAIMVAAALLE